MFTFTLLILQNVSNAQHIVYNYFDHLRLKHLNCNELPNTIVFIDTIVLNIILYVNAKLCLSRHDNGVTSVSVVSGLQLNPIPHATEKQNPS